MRLNMADARRHHEASLSSGRSQPVAGRSARSARCCWPSARRSACMPTCMARRRDRRMVVVVVAPASWSSSTSCSGGGATSSTKATSGLSHRGGPARPALRHDPVHRLRGDVLRRLVLGLLRRLRCSRPTADRPRHGVWPPKGIQTFDPVRPAAPEHADPAALGHHGHLGAPCAAARATARACCRAWR